MTIVHFRVDQRLIHGQVAISWTKLTNPNHIVVANDSASTDVFQKQILKLAAPKQVRLSIVTIDQTIRYLNKGLSENERVFLLTGNIMDARRIYENVPMLDNHSLNIGNMTHKTNSIKLSDKIFANPEELETIKWFLDENIDLYFQMLPGDKKEYFRNIIKEKEEEK